jgi:transcriptional regulator with XRE-family HTH domain
VYLALSAQVERQLREAYARKFEAGLATQSSIAEKLGIDRSAVHRRLTGRTNMTLETLADMVWALDQAIEVRIDDAGEGAQAEAERHVAARAARAKPGAAREILARAGKRQRPRAGDRLDAG